VSGPPGCGKSQVVVASLLNAWERGLSVIFASNNNKAVEVVRERVEKFESDFPIAIRAGARKVSNLEEALRRVLNAVAGGVRADTPRTRSLTNQSRLLDEKRMLTADLESQVPQRVDQALRSALNAYAQYRNAVAGLEESEGNQRASLVALQHKEHPETFEVEFLIRFPRVAPRL
jgi:KaiC/GvpD/RAD55 family RecA-like ATPase